mmetsp:Transcript_14161/g.39777  ORF Transcript_14161/g.39777 Transcript_14161/m.39777 type:complete len:204 (-) Transcript_14161:141-752(-)
MLMYVVFFGGLALGGTVLVACLFWCAYYVLWKVGTRTYEDERRAAAAEGSPHSATTRAVMRAAADEVLQQHVIVGKHEPEPGETCAICLGELSEGIVYIPDHGARTSASSAQPGVELGSTDVSRWRLQRMVARRLVRQRPGTARNVQASPGNDAPTATLPCGHHFHLECIRQWVMHRRAGASCPLCKREIALAASRTQVPEVV